MLKLCNRVEMFNGKKETLERLMFSNTQSAADF